MDVFIKNGTFEKNQFFEKALLGKTQRFNALGFCMDGNSVDINLTLIPIKDKRSKNIYVIIKNITEFQEQERELFLLQKKQETLMNLRIFAISTTMRSTTSIISLSNFLLFLE